MAGVRGRSGRRPKSAAAHILNGTFRKDRHARLLPAIAGATALQQASVPPVPKALIAGLGEPGLAFLLDIWSEYGDWNSSQLLLLRQAAVVADSLAEYEAAIARDGRLGTGKRGKRSPHPLLRIQAQAQRTFVLLLAKLDLKEK